MKETTLTIKIKVSDDNNHVEIVDPSTSEPICALILMGILKVWEISQLSGTKSIKAKEANNDI